jgi:serine/threonine-protein kinase RsbW
MNYCRIYLPQDLSQDDLECAVGEVLANCIEHGQATQIEVHCWTENGAVIVEIQDDGRGFEHQRIDDPVIRRAAAQQRGRGIFLMHALTDRVEFEDQGRRVRLTKRLPPATAVELPAGETA